MVFRRRWSKGRISVELLSNQGRIQSLSLGGRSPCGAPLPSHPHPPDSSAPSLLPSAVHPLPSLSFPSLLPFPSTQLKTLLRSSRTKFSQSARAPRPLHDVQFRSTPTLECWSPVTTDEVEKLISSAPCKTCELDPAPTWFCAYLTSLPRSTPSTMTF